MSYEHVIREFGIRKSSKEFRLCHSFRMYGQSIRLVVKEAISSECGAEVDHEVGRLALRFEMPGKAKQVCPLWPKRINPFGHNMIAPHGPNNIDHLVHILPEIFLCRFESPSPGVMGY